MPPRPLWRGLSVLILAGQVTCCIIAGHVHRRNTLQQLERIGPRSTGICLFTATFVGMAFTIQLVRKFTRLGLHRSVGGILALALSRELSPIVNSDVAASRVGFAFAAELGTMQVSEQTDTHSGPKGVGESTTLAVVISLVGIFIADFGLSYCFFQGAGDSLKYAMG